MDTGTHCWRCLFEWGVPFSTGRKGDGKSRTNRHWLTAFASPSETPHRERHETVRVAGCSIDWAGPTARAMSPFSRGRRTGRGDGMGPLHLAPVPFHPSRRDDLPPVGPFSPLGERLGGGPGLRRLRVRCTLPQRSGPESPPWRGLTPRYITSSVATVVSISSCGMASSGAKRCRIGAA
jgi:hypothetical protein